VSLAKIKLMSSKKDIVPDASLLGAWNVLKETAINVRSATLAEF
jgi:hypothetical protein